MTSLTIFSSVEPFLESHLSMLKRGFGSELDFTVFSRDPEKFLSDHLEFSGLQTMDFIAEDV